MATLRRLIEPGPTASFVHLHSLRQILRARGFELQNRTLIRLAIEAVPSAHVRRAQDYSKPDRRRGLRACHWTEEGRVASSWEDRLCRAGLEPSEATPHQQRVGDGTPVGLRSQLAEEYFRRAAHHQATWVFMSPLEKAIWVMHVEGMSEREIAAKAACNRSSVQRVILRHRRHAGISRRPSTAHREQAELYAAEAAFATQLERRVFWLGEVEGYCSANICAELKVELPVVRRVLAEHRDRLGLRFV